MTAQRFIEPEQYYTGFFGYITPHNDGKNMKLIRGSGTMYDAVQMPQTASEKATAEYTDARPRYKITSYRMPPQNEEVRALAAAELPYANLYNTTLGYTPSNY